MEIDDQPWGENVNVTWVINPLMLLDLYLAPFFSAGAASLAAVGLLPVRRAGKVH